MRIGQPLLAKNNGKIVECIVIDFSVEDILLEDKETKERFYKKFWEVRKINDL